MWKWLSLILGGALIGSTLKHAIELDKLGMKIQWLESIECPKPPPPVVCPICLPKVVELPCELECPEQDRCATYWEMCVE
jgi:hypothetical protein